MALFVKEKRPVPQSTERIKELEDAQRELEEHIHSLQLHIEEEPERVRQKLIDQRTTLPPLEDIEDRRRERRFYAHISRGEAQNERRYQAKSSLVLLLLVAATSAIAWWIYTYLQTHL